MPKTMRLKSWAAKAGHIFRRFWQMLEAMEQGPYGYMDERISYLEEKIQRMDKGNVPN